MGGDTNETDVRNLSESKRSEVTEDEMSTLSRVTRGLRGGRISRKKDATTVTLEPPKEVPVEGDKEAREACGMDGKTVKENTCVTPLYVREHTRSIGLDIAADASERT